MISTLIPLAARNALSFIRAGGGLKTVKGRDVAWCTASSCSRVRKPTSRMAATPVWA